MGHLIGGIVMPYLPRLAERDAQSENAPLARLSAAMEKAADLLKKRNPQSIVVLSPGGAVIRDAVSLYVHPRLKGSLAEAGLPEVVLGFETDGFLVRMLLKQGERLGIPFEALTDDVLEARQLSAKLGDASMVPLYYLHKAGFKGQVVNLSYDALAYEEMYTFGKAVRLAIEKSGKPTAVVVAAECPLAAEEDADRREPFIDAVQTLNAKPLLQADRSALDAAGANHLRALLFFLGALGGGTFAETSFSEQRVANSARMIACFFA